VTRALRLPPILVAAALAAGLAGCGGGSSPSPSDAVRTTWKQAATAAVDGQGTAFCSHVTAAGKAKITARTQLPCEDSIRLLASRLSSADKAVIHDAKITKVTVSGNDAVVTYATTPTLAALGFTGRTTLLKSGGHWLLVGI